ncbi:MAG: MAPEG family protein [Polyangiales bacterium]
MAVPVIALYAPLNAALNIFLANQVSNARRKHSISVGHGESEDVLRTLRAHGNNAEFVPLAIVMLLIAELMGGKSLWLHVMGGSLLLARIAHAFGIHERKTPNAARFLGTGVTWTVILAASAYALALRF